MFVRRYADGTATISVTLMDNLAAVDNFTESVSIGVTTRAQAMRCMKTHAQLGDGSLFSRRELLSVVGWRVGGGVLGGGGAVNEGGSGASTRYVVAQCVTRVQ